ncbi:MAG: GNAT family N-acetyltransferase [Ruminococcus sp.]|nr:GNAT family N-acetyltransferase [Ruminococcus sp.]
MEHTGTESFETPRLICRRFTAGDEEDMLRNWAADPDIQNEYGEPVYTDIGQVRQLLDSYIRGYNDPAFYRWAVIEKSSGENIGQIAFCKVYSDCATAEIEYCIGRRFWGNRYAGEALEGLIEHTFRNTDFRRLEAYHRAENVKSGRVLERSSMHITDNVERFRRENISPEGEVCYCIERIEISQP